MYTETTDISDAQKLRGWVLFDATCSWCVNLMARARPALRANGFRPEPLQSSWVRRRLNLPETLLMAEMRVLTIEGRVLGGADALVFLASEMAPGRRPWWAWLLVVASKMPFATPWMRSAYRWIAARRQCRQGTCSINGSQTAYKEGMQ